MSFLYGLVAQNTTPLADHAVVGGNYEVVAIRMLESLDPKNPRAILEQNKHVFVTITDQSRLTFLCVTESSVNPQLRIQFLEEMKRKWTTRYGSDAVGFGSYSKKHEFGPDINALLNAYNSERHQKIAAIKNNISDTQNEMTQNLTKALSRGVQLEVMSEKAESIKHSAETFHRDATGLRRAMCLEKYKWYFIGVVVILLIIYIILVIACGGFNLKPRCISSD